MYSLYLDGMLLPVTPKKIEMQIGGRSRLVTLMNDGQASILSSPELTQVRFDALLPQTAYPFARYEGGFRGAETYLAKLEALKTGKKPFRFVLSRWLPGGKRLFDTNLSVSLEEYSIVEDAAGGFDVVVNILLRQYRPLSAKVLEIDTGLPGAPVILEENRSVGSTAGNAHAGGSGGSTSETGKRIIAPSTGTKEAAAVAKKTAKAAEKSKVSTSSIPGLSTLLGNHGSDSGSTGSGKVTLVSRR